MSSDVVIKPTSAPAGSLGELWTMAYPLILSSGSISLMMVIDRIFLTWYSTEALAAVLPAGMTHWTLLSVVLGTVSYANSFVAQHEGAGEKTRVSAAVWQAVYMALAGGLLCLAVVPLAPWLCRLFEHDPVIERLEVEYLSMLLYGSLPLGISTALTCFFSGRGKTRIVLVVNVLSLFVNAGLDFVFIFGYGSIPSMGISGAALATNIAHGFACLAYLGFLIAWHRHDAYQFFRTWRLDPKLLARMIRFGLPAGLQWLGDCAGFTFFILLVGKLGTLSLAATNIAFNLNTFAFLPIIGIGTAVSTLVGQRIGEGRPELAARTTWLAVGLGGGLMLLTGVMYVLLPELILKPYSMFSSSTDFEELRPLVIVLLRFVAFYSFFDAMAILFASAVRGAGDTRFCLYYSLFGAWIVLVLPTFLMTKYGTTSLFGCWAICSAYVSFMGIGYYLRFRYGPWKSMTVLEHRPGEATPSSGDATSNHSPSTLSENDPPNITYSASAEPAMAETLWMDPPPVKETPTPY